MSANNRYQSHKNNNKPALKIDSWVFQEMFYKSELKQYYHLTDEFHSTVVKKHTFILVMA